MAPELEPDTARIFDNFVFVEAVIFGAVVVLNSSSLPVVSDLSSPP
jgi:hypothetical protein